MEDAINAFLDKVESLIRGFFWILSNLGIALFVFLLFLSGARAVKRAIVGVAQRTNRGDLGGLLGGFIKWSSFFSAYSWSPPSSARP